MIFAGLGHVSVAITLDIYTHINGGREPASAQPKKPNVRDCKPYTSQRQRPGTGCITELNDHLFEGRYSPIRPDGKKHARNVYAHTREECEEKLKVMIAQMKQEIAKEKKAAAEPGSRKKA